MPRRRRLLLSRRLPACVPFTTTALWLYWAECIVLSPIAVSLLYVADALCGVACQVCWAAFYLICACGGVCQSELGRDVYDGFACNSRCHLVLSLSPARSLRPFFFIVPSPSSAAGPVIKTFPAKEALRVSSPMWESPGGLLAPGSSRTGPLAHGAAHQNVLI